MLTDKTTQASDASELYQDFRREAYSNKGCQNSRADSQYAEDITLSSSQLGSEAGYGTYCKSW